MESQDPTENVQEQIQHDAHHRGERWTAGAALTAALLAALAAIFSAMAGYHLTQSSRAQIQSNDQWTYYQAKSIKSSVLRSKMDILAAMGKEKSPDDQAKLKEYESDLGSIKADAEKQGKASEAFLHRHESLEHGVTFFHIAIAVVAISLLTSRRLFWFAAMACGAAGLVLVIQAFAPHSPDHSPGPDKTAHVESAAK